MFKTIIILMIPAVVFGSTTTEGFIRFKEGGHYLEKGLNSNAVYPGTEACESKSVSDYRDHYVLVEWNKDVKKPCFQVKAIKRITYDPLKGSLSPFRKNSNKSR